MQQMTRATAIQEHDYLAYIVRMWQVRSQGRLVWRASAATHNGERRVFADLPALFAFLAEKTGGMVTCTQLEGNIVSDDADGRAGQISNLEL